MHPHAEPAVSDVEPGPGAIEREARQGTVTLSSPDLYLSARQRVGRLALISSAMMVAFIPISVVHALTTQAPHPWIANLLLASAFLNSALMTVAVYGLKLSDQTITRVALVWAVLGAWIADLSSNAEPVLQGGRYAPWSAVWILLFPVAIAAPPRLGAIAVALAALGSPLSLVAWSFFGVPMPSVTDFFGMVTASGVVAAIAILPMMVVWRQQQRITTVETRAARMGSYELEQRIGLGGAGEVWQARHAMLARGAAIKLINTKRLPADPIRRAESLAAFRREADITARLECPHTVAIFDFGLSPQGPLYIAMELIDGVDLRRLVRDVGALPPSRVCALLAQVCESLSEAHRLGLVHADIKPANIMLCRRGGKADFIKVLDFGLAHEFASSGGGDGVIRGTPAYMPPEIARGEPAQPASDVYALGCVAWELLTGRPVFLAGSTTGQVRDHVHREPEPPSRYASHPVPRALDLLILECLSKDPAARPPSVDDVRRRLSAMPCPSAWTEADAEAWWDAHEAQLRRREPVVTPASRAFVEAETHGSQTTWS